MRHIWHISYECAILELLVCRQETCKKLHGLIDKIDEERYDIVIKVSKVDKEVNSPRWNPTTKKL